MDKIIIKGAREHNLKNIDIELPRDKLIVISGLSGSGKSSLAFDTIFAEGQRRYMESVSTYARQFLGRMDKPDVDYIEGLSPAISIEQKTTHNNPRSTVGTVTEIYDYYRLLYARVGTPHCPCCGKEIEEQSIDQIVDSLMALSLDSRLMVMAPVVRGRKGEHKKIFEDAKKSGFARVRINGEMHPLEDEITLDKNFKYDIDIVIDRIKIDGLTRQRLAEAVETASDIANGLIRVLIYLADNTETDKIFSLHAACIDCGINLPELQPRLFSFNNPYGACPACLGLGSTMDFDMELVIPDDEKSFNQHGIVTHNPKSAWYRSWFEALAEKYSFSLDVPIKEWSPKVLDIVLNGNKEDLSVVYQNKEKNRVSNFTRPFEGVLTDIKRRYRESASNMMKDWFEGFMRQSPCCECGGRRLRPESLAVTIGEMSIDKLTALSVKDSIVFFEEWNSTETEKLISGQILKEIISRLTFLKNVGLGYLNLSRRSGTLSGGEAQRIRLATQIGSQLMGVLYILDEPSIGLHQRDNDRLIETLKSLRDIGNTLIVVEHDEQTLREADYLVDLGPGAGVNGGQIIAQGTPQEVMLVKESLTGQYLAGTLEIPPREERRKGNGLFLEINGATQNNLKNIDVKIPLGTFTVISGVSGSGKSTLMSSILFPAVNNLLNRTHHEVGKHKEILGIENIDKIININQAPIGRTPRSNPATYIGLFNFIRDLYAQLPDSKARGYRPGRFSFNVNGGRCEHCKGDGNIKIEMHFLPDVYIVCDQCKGKRYNKETLEVRYKGKNISDVLEMPVEEAFEFFAKNPVINQKLQLLCDVGLGYIKLGQSALTLSGGEAQRIKLAAELSKRSTGKTLYILDEPTTGLHYVDVMKLLEVLQKLADTGNTLLLIEHNLDVIFQADYVIDLGPEGGDKGGEILCCGTPEEVAQVTTSWTGQYLKKMIKE